MKKELFKNQQRIMQLGMDLDEVANIFSEETLSTMAMNHVVGGDGVNNCAGGNCVPGCGTTNTNYACPSVSISISISASVSVKVVVVP